MISNGDSIKKLMPESRLGSMSRNSSTTVPITILNSSHFPCWEILPLKWSCFFFFNLRGFVVGLFFGKPKCYGGGYESNTMVNYHTSWVASSNHAPDYSWELNSVLQSYETALGLHRCFFFFWLWNLVCALSNILAHIKSSFTQNTQHQELGLE